jgi:hypothetical protein
VHADLHRLHADAAPGTPRIVASAGETGEALGAECEADLGARVRFTRRRDARGRLESFCLTLHEHDYD